MSERITLSVELVDDAHEARCSMRIPYEDSVIFGPWLDNAIKELRETCQERLREMARSESEGKQ